MLFSLHVKNLAIIDEVEVFFSHHLNILTGETGAGKSIIIGSINIALGGKVTMDMIRKGADYALVELVFQIEEESLVQKLRNKNYSVDDGQLIISRKITNGRTISKINGETVTTGALKEIAGALIDIHGQHEHQSLLYKNRHLEIVDRYGKEELGSLKEELAECFHQYKMAKKELEEACVSQEKRLRETSFMEYEYNEIISARLLEGEDDDLAQRYKRLSNANTIAEGLSVIYGLTGEEENSVSEQIGRAVRLITKLEEYDDNLNSLSMELGDMESLISDFNRNLSDYLSDFTYDNGEFTVVENRLNLINNIKAKYGNTIQEIIKYAEELAQKLEKYQNYEQYISQLKGSLSKHKEKLEELMDKASKIRKKKAKNLAIKIHDALVDLNFLDVRFAIEVRKLDRYTEQGYDEVEFMISTNPGEDMKPLGKVASGGELSRIMLAIKSVLADNDSINTLIFDEIDVGVSGRTAQKVSEKLSVIASKHQVICITHLPQIAAMADEHFVIEKQTDGDTTKTTIRLLKEEEAVEELARILGGAKITESVMVSAKEMKELASNTKIY